MAGADTTLPRLRAVLLSRDPILGARALRLCAEGWQAVRVDSGYEAAAEILAAPVAVLLIDFRSLTGLHRGLLALARRMEVRMVAIAGESPPEMTGDDLKGLRRIEVGDIPAELASARVSQAGGAAGADESAPVAAPAETQPVPAADRPEPSPAAEPAPVPAQTAAPSARDKPVELTPKSGKHRTPAGLLTPQELASLLEDEQ